MKVIDTGDIGRYVALSDRLVLFPHGLNSTIVWDMEDNRSTGVLEGHTNIVQDAAINDDATMSLTMSHNNGVAWPVKIWSLGTMQCTANLTSSSYIHSLFKDCLLLESENTIKVWDIGGSTPVALMDLEGHAHTVNHISVYSIVASCTSNVALSGSALGYLCLWDLRTGKCVRVMEGHTDAVWSVSMDSACKTAVSGSDDRSVKLWDLGSGRCINTYQHDQEVQNVMMHESGGTFLAVGTFSIKAWTTTSGSDQHILEHDFSSYCNRAATVQGAASRDLSKVAMSYMRPDMAGLGVKMWKSN